MWTGNHPLVFPIDSGTLPQQPHDRQQAGATEVPRVMQTILVVEDEKDLAELIAFHLEKEGFRPVIAEDGVSALSEARANPPQLILLDMMLPGMMGTEVLRLLKSSEKTAAVPVVVLTAKGEEIDRVVGFELGADDYVVKPFSVRELMLRIRAVLRRQGETPKASLIVLGHLSIDTDQHLVTVGGEEVQLTSTEYKLLMNLAERPGRVQSRELLLQNVWGYNYIGDTRTVDTHLTRLRSKLGEAGEMIKTVRGFGYKIDAP